MGTPEFAVETLRALVENHYNVVGVVTQPDRPVGRHGSQLQPSAVKQFALQHGLPVLQPEKMKDPQFLEQLRQWQANLQVVVAFRMLPEVVWAMPEFGTFNVHASLLPQYRGAAPINWAIINGDTTTGVTTFMLDHEIDTGRIIMQKPCAIADNDTLETVYDRLMQLGARCCLETLDHIVEADGHPDTTGQDQLTTTQDAAALRPAPKLFRDNTRIDWTIPRKQVYDFVRGLTPVPCAWTMLRDQQGREVQLKIYRATKTQSVPAMPQGARPGTIVTTRHQLYVACADGLLQIDELQLAGKKRMDAASLMNGLRDLPLCELT